VVRGTHEQAWSANRQEWQKVDENQNQKADDLQGHMQRAFQNRLLKRVQCVSRKHTVGYLIFKLTGGGISKAAAEARVPLVQEQVYNPHQRRLDFLGR
jgi:hypothetical protein